MNQQDTSTPGSNATWISLLALAVAVATLAGSLWLSLGMNLKACPLCFYQRTFVMGVVGIMVVGFLTRAAGGVVLCLLSLPLAVAAVGVAGIHVALEVNGTLECPAGIFGIGSAPQQSLAGLLLLSLLLLLDVARHAKSSRSHGAGIFISIVIGGLLAYASIISSPALPPAPDQPYDAPPDVCRPPYLERG